MCSSQDFRHDEENEKVVRKGMVRIVEDLDRYGKAVSKKPSQQIVLRMPENAPEPFKANYDRRTA